MYKADGSSELTNVCWSRDVAGMMSAALARDGSIGASCHRCALHCCTLDPSDLFTFDSVQVVILHHRGPMAPRHARLPTRGARTNAAPAGRCAALRCLESGRALPGSSQRKQLRSESMHGGSSEQGEGVAAIGSARRHTYTQKRPPLTEAPRRACPSRAARGTFKSTRTSRLGLHPLMIPDQFR